MEPTIRAGDHVIASPLTYLFREPARGDIVVFKPCKNISEEYWIHRIIAVGGDSVTQENGRLKVNEQSISFDQTIQKGNRKVRVPAGQYYQKGDNINSIEGLIDKSYVKSKVLWTFRLPGMTSIVFLVLILYIAIHGNILFCRLSRLCANRTGQYMIDNFVLWFPNKRRAFLEQFKDDKEVMDAFLRFKKFYWQMTIILLMLALVKFLQFVI
jgi:signal peptidase I